MTTYRTISKQHGHTSSLKKKEEGKKGKEERKMGQWLVESVRWGGAWGAEGGGGGGGGNGVKKERERKEKRLTRDRQLFLSPFLAAGHEMVTSKHRKANEYSLYPSLSVYSQWWVVNLHTDLECLFPKAGCQSPQ